MRIIALVIVMVSWAAPASPQTFHGGIRGAVRDADGVAPRVAITLTNGMDC